MKQKILHTLAFTTLILSAAQAQKNLAYAVTAEEKGSFNWNVIRQIDLSTGAVVKTLYSPAQTKTVRYKSVGSSEQGNSSYSAPTGSGVAATAFDALHNRLYFTAMRSNNLMYFDFGASELNVVVNDNPAFNTGPKNYEGNVITRMAFGSDGFGYALTNDGKSLIRFTTDQKPTVTNLGELVDGKKNGSMSVQSQCSCWGGDMVGDSYGNLYLVTYRNHLFKINPQTRVADYIGQIKGLPADFTSNGMVVNDDGEMIVSSATLSDNYYKVNVSTLDAMPVDKKEDKVYNCSDLANGNLLYSNKDVKDNFIRNEILGNQQVSIFPNPVTANYFTVQFDKVPAGKYNLELSDASGRSIFIRSLNINLPGQVERISLPRVSPKGMYMIKLTGGDKKLVYKDKIVVQ